MRALMIATAMVALVPLAACGGGEEAQPAKTVAAKGPRFTVSAVTAPEWKDVSAEIATVDQAHAVARIPGILTTLGVREGDLVKKGQVIGRIVDNRLAYESGAYGAQAAAAQAQAGQAQAELARVKYLYENGVYARARLEQAQAAAAAANAQIRAAKAQQSAVTAVAGQGAVTAPASGRVLHADVPAGSAVAPGMSIATITAGAVILRLELPESLAGKVHAGSRVYASGIGDGEAVGTVAKVYPSVQAGQIMADVNMSGLDSTLIGRRVPARVEVGTRTALLVPKTFVTSRYGLDYVNVVGKDGSAATVPVQTAPSTESGKVEILSGVTAGDTLVQAAG